MKKIILSVFALAALCCCTKEAPVNEEQGNNEQSEITVPESDASEKAKSIICSAPTTTEVKTATSGTDGTIAVVWMNEDAVKVYGENFTDGVTYTATLGENSSTATFKSSEGVTDATRYAVYPASHAGSMSGDIIDIDLSALKSYSYHSSIPNFGDNSLYSGSVVPSSWTGTEKEYFEASSIFPHLPLYAKSTDDSFTFTNLCGGLKVNLNDYQGNGIKISKIKLIADDYVSGTMKLKTDGTFTLDGTSDEEKTISVATTASSGIKISPADYTATSPNLTRGPYGKYYFFLPAKTYGTLTFEITDTDGRVYTQSTNNVTVKAGSVDSFKTLQLTLYYGTTNCYQTTPGQTVNIDITPYYSFDSRLRRSGNVVGGTVPDLTPAVLWELKTGSTATSLDNTVGDIVSSTSITGNTMSVTVGSNTGNAVVAVKNGDDVMWSWHIWVSEDTPKDLQYKIDGDAFYMMDRDLGAVWAPTISTTAPEKAYKTYGMMYEWGRKDPLPTYGALNGEGSKKNYEIPSTLLFDQIVNLRAYVKMCLNNPTTRIVSKSEATNAYLYPTDKTNFLFWGTPSDITYPTSTSELPAKYECVKTVYDPCPEGYMVPQTYHFSGLHNAGTVSKMNCNARQGYVVWFIFNDAVEGSASADDITFFNLRGVLPADKAPNSGTNDNVSNNGTYANVWTSTPWGGGWGGSVFQAKYSKIDDSYVAWKEFNGLSATSTNSVRCVKQ